MRKIIVPALIMMLFILLFSHPAEAASGYGWGYKKNTNNEVPEIGKYERFIKEYDAYFVDEAGDKNVYLTFDNGYEQGYTNDILTILKEEEVPATFFVTGHYVESEPELLKRMVNDGHIIGNHSYHHPDFSKLSKEAIKEELETLEQAVANETDQKKLKYLRPPRGIFNEQTMQWANDLGYIHVFWSLAFNDWQTNKQKGWEYAYDQVMAQIHPGAIVLLHTVSSDNAESLSKIIGQLKEDGYQFKSLDDLVLKNIMFKGMYNIE